MLRASLARRLGRLLLGASVASLALSQGVRAEDDRDHDWGNPIEQIMTASPIKHVIIIVGENRSFDHLFATYVPKAGDERVLNLLSEHIVKADGSPDENFAAAHQFQHGVVARPRLRGIVGRGIDRRMHRSIGMHRLP